MNSDMWTYYEVQMDFLTSLCASVPASKDLIDKWIAARMAKKKPKGPDVRSIEQISQEVYDSVPLQDPDADESLLVFQRFEGGLAMRAATVRSHYKEAARILSSLWIGTPERGEGRSFASKVLSGVFPDETQYWLPILRQDDDQPIREPDGTIEKPIHAVDRRTGNAINALKAFEYVDRARLKFRLKVLTTLPRERKKVDKETGKEIVTVTPGSPIISLDDSNHLFNYGGVKGYAGERSAGEGKYVATISKVAE